MSKIHVGCGERYFPGWYHVDGAKYDHVSSNDIALHDLMNDSADIIYASHLLSYFDYYESEFLLVNWYRVLKPGGILRLAVPNFEIIAKLYNSGWMLGHFIGPLYGKMKMNNSNIYHRLCYDFKSLSGKLIDCGYKDIRRYDWRETEHAHIDDHSQAYIPHMDKENGILISLNVEATK